MTGTLFLLAGLVAAFVPSGLALLLHRPQSLITVAFVAAFAAQTSFAENAPLISRLPIVLMFVLAVKLAFDNQHLVEQRMKVDGRLGLPLLMIVMLALSTVATSISPLVSLQATVAASALFYAASGIARFMPVADLLNRIAWIAATTVIASLVLSPVLPDAYLGGRLSGVFRNPNSLGAAAIVACAALPGRYFARLGPFLVLATVISGSRAGALGVALVLLVRVRWSRTAVLLAILIAPILAVGVFGVGTPPAEPAPTSTSASADESLSILRTKDNRTAQWGQGVTDAQAAWPFGEGFGASRFEYSNSALFLLVETGILALPIAGFALAAITQARQHRDKRVVALVLSLLAHSQFEGWMFAFGSPQAAVFWLIVIAAACENPATPRPQRDSPGRSPTFEINQRTSTPTQVLGGYS